MRLPQLPWPEINLNTSGFLTEIILRHFRTGARLNNVQFMHFGGKPEQTALLLAEPRQLQTQKTHARPSQRRAAAFASTGQEGKREIKSFTQTHREVCRTKWAQVQLSWCPVLQPRHATASSRIYMQLPLGWDKTCRTRAMKRTGMLSYQSCMESGVIPHTYCNHHPLPSFWTVTPKPYLLTWQEQASTQHLKTTLKNVTLTEKQPAAAKGRSAQAWRARLWHTAPTWAGSTAGGSVWAEGGTGRRAAMEEWGKPTAGSSCPAREARLEVSAPGLCTAGQALSPTATATPVLPWVHLHKPSAGWNHSLLGLQAVPYCCFEA